MMQKIWNLHWTCTSRNDSREFIAYKKMRKRTLRLRKLPLLSGGCFAQWGCALLTWLLRWHRVRRRWSLQHHHKYLSKLINSKYKEMHGMHGVWSYNTSSEKHFAASHGVQDDAFFCVWFFLSSEILVLLREILQASFFCRDIKAWRNITTTAITMGTTNIATITRIKRYYILYFLLILIAVAAVYILTFCLSWIPHSLPSLMKCVF